jgi:hypothetical protein
MDPNNPAGAIAAVLGLVMGIVGLFKKPQGASQPQSAAAPAKPAVQPTPGAWTINLPLG